MVKIKKLNFILCITMVLALLSPVIAQAAIGEKAVENNTSVTYTVKKDSVYTYKLRIKYPKGPVNIAKGQKVLIKPTATYDKYHTSSGMRVSSSVVDIKGTLTTADKSVVSVWGADCNYLLGLKRGTSKITIKLTSPKLTVSKTVYFYTQVI